jgi:hypothetical protein
MLSGSCDGKKFPLNAVDAAFIILLERRLAAEPDRHGPTRLLSPGTFFLSRFSARLE